MDELKPNTSEVSGRPLNRADDIDVSIDNVEDTTQQFLTVTLETIDSAIMYYFENVIKPQVMENGAVVKVPVMYGSQERWKSVRQDGFIRDNKGRILTPAIMFKRNSVAKDTNIPIDKMDANNPQLYYTVQKRYTQKNRFDNFSVLTNQAPIREFYNVVMPDYIVATYDVILWTTYIKQMNGIVESMVFASDAYWGDSSKWKFRTTVSDIATPVEISNEEDRTVRGTFTLTVNGYLVPNTLNAILAKAGSQVKKSLSVKKIVVFEEMDGETVGRYDVSTRKPDPKLGVSSQRVAVYTTAGGEAMSAALNQMLSYLNKQFVKQSSTITVPDTVTWSGVTIDSPPAEWPLTPGAQPFIFFINGQLIEPSAIVSFSQVGSDAVLVVNTTLLGYSLGTTDEIVAVGKFAG
jgi:hypothetical protein